MLAFGVMKEADRYAKLSSSHSSGLFGISQVPTLLRDTSLGRTTCRCCVVGIVRDGSCFGLLPLAPVFQCPKCNQIFCFDCDIFLHDSVHSCPGCVSNPVISQNYGNVE
ncbi:hypothetical protein Avbf_07811 [Armadillidium vulgare]|nr:hypothetical protein Avbf_07811 [Armadillidium vulgare]